MAKSERQKMREFLEALDKANQAQHETEDFAVGRWVRTQLDGSGCFEHTTVVKVSEKAVRLALRNGVAAWFPRSWVKNIRRTTTYAVYEFPEWIRQKLSPEQTRVLGLSF